MDWLRDRLHALTTDLDAGRAVLRAGQADGLVRLTPDNIMDIQMLGCVAEHREVPWNATFLSDSRSIIVGLDDAVVRQDLSTGEVSAPIDSRPCVQFSISADRRLVAVCGGESADPEDDFAAGDAVDTDYTVRIWRTTDSHHIADLVGLPTPPMELALAPDGQTVAALSEENNVYIWSVDRRMLLHTLTEDRECSDIFYLSDGTLAVCGSDCRVRLWRPDGERMLVAPAADKSVQIRVAAAPTTCQLALCDGESRFYIWPDFTQDGAAPLVLTQAGAINCRFSPDSTIFISNSTNGEVCFWSSASGTLLRRIPSHQGVPFVAIAPNQRVVAIGNSDKKVNGRSSITLWGVRSPVEET